MGAPGIILPLAVPETVLLAVHTEVMSPLATQVRLNGPPSVSCIVEPVDTRAPV